MFEARRWASSLMAGVLAAQLIPVLPARAFSRLAAWAITAKGELLLRTAGPARTWPDYLARTVGGPRSAAPVIGRPGPCNSSFEISFLDSNRSHSFII
mgnify:CR=1 FL=1